MLERTSAMPLELRTALSLPAPPITRCSFCEKQRLLVGTGLPALAAVLVMLSYTDGAGYTSIRRGDPMSLGEAAGGVR